METVSINIAASIQHSNICYKIEYFWESSEMKFWFVYQTNEWNKQWTYIMQE